MNSRRSKCPRRSDTFRAARGLYLSSGRARISRAWTPCAHGKLDRRPSIRDYSDIYPVSLCDYTASPHSRACSGCQVMRYNAALQRKPRGRDFSVRAQRLRLARARATGFIANSFYTLFPMKRPLREGRSSAHCAASSQAGARARAPARG